MSLLLDTSVAIALGEVAHSALARFEKLEILPFLSTLTLVELYGGLAPVVVDLGKRRELIERLEGSLTLLDFRTPDARAYRAIIETLGFSRAKVIDRMIAAQALVAGVPLATLNPRDFRDIPGLTIEDWS